MSHIKPKIITALWLAAGLLVCGYSSADSSTSQDSQLNIESAYVTALIPGQEVSAGYISISNSGDQDQLLQSFSSSAAQMVQLHETTMSNGMMSMDKIDDLVVPAGASINMQPGGLHLMIMGVDKAAFAGDSVDMQIRFASGEVIDINIPVRKSF